MRITEEQSRAQGPAHSRCLGDAVKVAWAMGGLCSGPAVWASGREAPDCCPYWGSPGRMAAGSGRGFGASQPHPLAWWGQWSGDPGTHGQQPSAWDPAQPELADASKDTLASWCEHEAHA